MVAQAGRHSSHPQLLVGTAAHNSHVQNMVKALYETGGLYAYFSGGVDVWHGPAWKRVRQWIGSGVPTIERELSRRAVHGIPETLIWPRWRWELPRAIAGRFPSALRVEDWLWERGEHDLDRRCAGMLACPDVDGFFGVEHGALHAIREAHSVSKPAVVAFLSPHRQTRARWVDSEFDRHPEFGARSRSRLDDLGVDRDARRDDEAREAEWIVSGSSFTTRSLIDAGLTADKILTIPLGGPDPTPVSDLPDAAPKTRRLIYVGPVSVRKGAHYLLRAWRRAAGANIEMHFYGKVLLPARLIADALSAPGGDRLFFHGSVPASTLGGIYSQASLLVLPTLCDGFGQVVSDALAHGLPVLTTTNAGAADCIDSEAVGFVIPPADEDAIAARLAWCGDHPQHLFEMRRAALARAAAWTWGHFRRQFAADVYAALDRTIAQSRPRALA